jgi:hypothetical protein
MRRLGSTGERAWEGEAEKHPHGWLRCEQLPQGRCQAKLHEREQIRDHPSTLKVLVQLYSCKVSSLDGVMNIREEEETHAYNLILFFFVVKKN